MHCNDSMQATQEQTCSDPEPLYELRGHRSTVLSVCFSPDAQSLITGGLDAQLLFYRLNRSGHHFRLNGHTDAINSVHFGFNPQADQTFILSGSRDKTVRLWRYNANLSRPEVDETSPVVYHCGSTVRFVHSSPDGLHFCTGSDDKSIKIWSTQVPNKRITTLLGHTNWVKCCKFSSTDVNLVASCGDDSTLRLFDLRVHVRKGACVKTLEATRNRHFTHLDWFPKHSHYIAVASSNAMIRIYDLRNAASIVQFYAPHTQSVNAVSFHPSGAYLLSCSTDRSCKLIDVQEGRLLYTLRGHTKPLFACAFDRDGRHFVTAGADAGVRLWQSNLPASSSSSSSSIITDDHLTKCDYSNGPLDSAGQPDQRCEFGKRKNALNGIDAQSNYSSVAKSSVVDSMFTFPMNQTSFDQQSLDATVDGHHQLLDNHSSHHRSHCAESSLKGSKSLQSLVKGSPSSLEVNEIRHVMKQMLQDIQTFTDTLTRLESRLTFLEDKMLN